MKKQQLKKMSVVLPGGAGLVGQNLIISLKNQGVKALTVIDKHKANTAILKKMHPDIEVIDEDLAQHGSWVKSVEKADIVVMLQAQIGGEKTEQFIRNNIVSTRNVLSAMKRAGTPGYLIHISSSVVESVADDDYTNTKKEQEKLVAESGLAYTVLRPTLMFGWFDRKHLGWLSRFMKKVLVFPIPGHGRYLRQPLFVKDFCSIIISSMVQQPEKAIYNITGLTPVYYIDMIRQIKTTIQARTLILNIPYELFRLLLKLWAVFDKDPPFTSGQLEALVADDVFEVIDWPFLFNVRPTPLKEALEITFNDPCYSAVKLRF